MLEQRKLVQHKRRVEGALPVPDTHLSAALLLLSPVAFPLLPSLGGASKSAVHCTNSTLSLNNAYRYADVWQDGVG